MLMLSAFVCAPKDKTCFISLKMQKNNIGMQGDRGEQMKDGQQTAGDRKAVTEQFETVVY